MTTFWYIETEAVKGFVFGSLLAIYYYSAKHNDPVSLIRKAKPGEHLGQPIWLICKDGTILGE